MLEPEEKELTDIEKSFMEAVDRMRECRFRWVETQMQISERFRRLKEQGRVEIGEEDQMPKTLVES